MLTAAIGLFSEFVDHVTDLPDRDAGKGHQVRGPAHGDRACRRSPRPLLANKNGSRVRCRICGIGLCSPPGEQCGSQCSGSQHRSGKHACGFAVSTFSPRPDPPGVHHPVCFTHTHVEPGSDTPLSDNFSQSYSYGCRRTRFDHLVVFAIDFGDSDVPFYEPSPFGDIVSVLRRSSGYEELDGSNVDRAVGGRFVNSTEWE